jgi:hypothetical protein
VGCRPTVRRAGLARCAAHRKPLWCAPASSGFVRRQGFGTNEKSRNSRVTAIVSIGVALVSWPATLGSAVAAACIRVAIGRWPSPFQDSVEAHRSTVAVSLAALA